MLGAAERGGGKGGRQRRRGAGWGKLLMLWQRLWMHKVLIFLSGKVEADGSFHQKVV